MRSGPCATPALTDDRHIGELYELTGPRLLTFAEAVLEISRAVGREIRYVPTSIEDFAAAAAEHGVQRALGRQPRDFSDYARHAAASGIWNPIATRAA